MKLKIFLCVLLAGLSAPAQTNMPVADQTNGVATVKTNHLSAYSVHVVTADEVNAGLKTISNRIALLNAQISDLKKQDSVYEQEMGLRWKAGQISIRDSVAAQENHMSETNKKIKPLENEIAVLQLQDFEICKRYSYLLEKKRK
jgi:cell division protein FtsB